MARLSGNPVDVFLPADATESQQAALERSLGLDQPLPIQYLKFVGNALRGDFGRSINWGDQTAMGLVAQRFPATLQLAVIAMGISLLIAVPIGVLSAVKKDSIFDYIWQDHCPGRTVPAPLLAGHRADLHLRRPV